MSFRWPPESEYRSTLHRSSGILHYKDNPLKLIVEIDPGITEFYRALIPKWIRSNRQLYTPHISTVRKEIPPRMELWGLHEGEEIEFWYENIVRCGEVYLWLNVFSVRLEEIRLELGLLVSSPYTLPPEGFAKCFHTTIGNFK